MRLRARLIVPVLVLAIAGCSGPASPGHQPTATGSGGATADVILTNADLVTLDDATRGARAVAVAGQRILAVGSAAEVDRFRGRQTVVVDLGGRTVVPGFIDAHQYRVLKHAGGGFADPASAVQAAVAQGWTTLDELYVDQGEIAELRDLDQSGKLPVHVNAYLPFMQYDPAGTSLGSWYQAYRPGQALSAHVRVAGLIGFADYDNAKVLLWRQDALNAFLLSAARQGWPVALKTVSTRSLQMIINGYRYVAQVAPTVAKTRNRLEHTLFISPDQITAIKQLGLIPVINLNNPGQLVGETDVDQLISREPPGTYAPWRSLEQAAVRVGNGTGWPSYFVNEPTGAPFGAPMHLLFQAVTRVGNLGRQPYPWLLDQTITAEQALRALTIDSAYASSEETTKGSITPGKLADLVVLSGNPLTVPAQQINQIQVLMTMIDGKARWCAPGQPAACPATASAPASASASSPPQDHVSGGWTAVDPADGSAMTLTVTAGGGGFLVVLVDAKASACGLDQAGKPRFAARIEATGTLQGDLLHTTVTSLTCLTSPPTTKRPSLTIDYTYRGTTDTLVDSSQGVTWHRR